MMVLTLSGRISDNYLFILYMYILLQVHILGNIINIYPFNVYHTGLVWGEKGRAFWDGMLPILQWFQHNKFGGFYTELLICLLLQVSIPAWFTVDTRLGSLSVHLDTPQCFSAEMYSADLNIVGKPEDDKVDKILISSFLCLFFPLF